MNTLLRHSWIASLTMLCSKPCQTSSICSLLHFIITKFCLVGKSEYNPPFSGLRAASTCEAVGFCGSHRQTDVLAKLSSWLGGWSLFCGDNSRHTAQVRERRSLRCRHLWVGGYDRQSSHPVKTLLQYYGKSLEALPGVAYPGFRDNRSTLNTKTGYKKYKKDTAVFGQVGLTAHGLESRLVFARAVCWPRVHLQQAWIGCWNGLLNRARLRWHLARAPSLIWILLMSLLAELLELVSILETMASEAAYLELEVNCQKTKVQALGCREDMPLSIKVQGQDVLVVEEFVYLGSFPLNNRKLLRHQLPNCHHLCCHADHHIISPRLTKAPLIQCSTAPYNTIDRVE